MRVATASPVRVIMASAAMSEQTGPRLASLAMSAKSGRVRGLSITERRRKEQEAYFAGEEAAAMTKQLKPPLPVLAEAGQPAGGEKR